MISENPVIVIGAGGHGKVVLAAIKALGITCLGVADSNFERLGEEFCGVKVLGGDEIVLKYSPSEVLLVNGIGSIGKIETRRVVFERYKDRGYRFLTLIHPTSIVDPDVKMGEGSFVGAGSVLQVGVEIGSNVLVNTRVSIDHDTKVGDHSHLAPGALICGGVRVEKSVHVGAGAVVVQGVQLGSFSIVGAGSVVLKDVMHNTTVFGVPAKARQS